MKRWQRILLIVILVVMSYRIVSADDMPPLVVEMWLPLVIKDEGCCLPPGPCVCQAGEED